MLAADPAPLSVLRSLVLVVPAALPLLSAALIVAPARRGAAGSAAWSLARMASGIALAAAAVSLALTVVAGGAASPLLRADLVGGVMLLLVGFIGWVIVRYSAPYLDAEPNERRYVAWLLLTLTAVTLVVISNHLLLLVVAWSATSFALHRLLTFFSERPAAVLAAHKKFIAGRLADAAMLTAAGMLYGAYGTLQIDQLAAQAANGLSSLAAAAVALVAVAALLRCAQLPAHGWLIQVMEAPTPVSALLHAGIVNLGGFVLIRLAPLVADVPAAQLLLVAAGGITAIVAALVMTTRVSIKVALAWSTCAQMGFMLMQCGLGLYEMALLHIVAHSLYKAHAFLSAGSVVRQVSIRRLATVTAPAGLSALVAGAALGVAMTAAAAFLWARLPGADAPSAALLAAAMIVALALTPLLHTGSGSAGYLRSAGGAFALALAYFGLHHLFAGWVAPAMAGSSPPGLLLPLLVVAGFAGLFILQCLVTANPAGPLARRLYPWFYGGLYLDERVSRAAFRMFPPPAIRASHTPPLPPQQQAAASPLSAAGAAE